METWKEWIQKNIVKNVYGTWVKKEGKDTEQPKENNIGWSKRCCTTWLKRWEEMCKEFPMYVQRLCLYLNSWESADKCEFERGIYLSVAHFTEHFVSQSQIAINSFRHKSSPHSPTTTTAAAIHLTFSTLPAPSVSKGLPHHLSLEWYTPALQPPPPYSAIKSPFPLRLLLPETSFISLSQDPSMYPLLHQPHNFFPPRLPTPLLPQNFPSSIRNQ